ncbi:MAG: 2-oxoacid:acceptor oxidoreductase family protein [Candidatus Thermoplasmatota archaeon]|nr:2-oxoacid:acceptor oxidoreductase family protein [Candidatus Thermoplasmatota archaeon]
MLEVRFHGRGGQGAVTASKILALAAFLRGEQVISFPFFGTERRGAPVTAFTRIDSDPIMLKTQVYEPDIVVVLDQYVMKTVDVTSGMKPNSKIIINSRQKPAELKIPYSTATVDATSIAISLGLGNRANPIINTAIMGALVRATGIVDLESMKESVYEMSPAKKDANVRAVMAAYSSTMSGGR